jgi:hypothetical protein
MLRNRLRTLEQQINATEMPEDCKVKLQATSPAATGRSRASTCSSPKRTISFAAPRPTNCGGAGSHGNSQLVLQPLAVFAYSSVRAGGRGGRTRIRSARDDTKAAPERRPIDGASFEARVDLAQRSARTFGDSIGWLWSDAQAPSWLSRGGRRNSDPIPAVNQLDPALDLICSSSAASAGRAPRADSRQLPALRLP